MPRHGAAPEHERRQQVAELRAAGHTFAAIARRLGITKQAAQQLVARHEAEAGEPHCKACKRVFPGARDLKANRGGYCLACLAKHPEATFGERLKSHRLAAGLSRRELAKRAGLDDNVVNLYERDRPGEPKWSIVRRLALVLGIEFLGLEEVTGGKRQAGQTMNDLATIALDSKSYPLWTVFMASRLRETGDFRAALPCLRTQDNKKYVLVFTAKRPAQRFAKENTIQLLELMPIEDRARLGHLLRLYQGVGAARVGIDLTVQRISKGVRGEDLQPIEGILRALDTMS